MYSKPEPDENAERSIISGIFTYGEDAYLDVADIVTQASFTKYNHAALYECICYIFDRKEEVKKIDPSTLISAANEIGYKDFIENPTEREYIKKLFNFGNSIEFNTIRLLAGKIRKLEIARDLQQAILGSAKDISKIKGTESFDEILSVIEKPIEKEIEKLFNQNSTKIKLISDGIDCFVDNLINNPVKTFGIPSPFETYNRHIGGGFIKKELDIIAARAKQGKSFLADNVGYHIASNNIPVLNIDTELSQEQHWIRMLGMISGVNMEEIKTGQFGQDRENRERVLKAKEKLKSIPYYYECVGGKEFEEVLSIIRRWVQKHVGIDENGNRKPCLIIYDYIKLLNEGGISQVMAEYQKLGFMVTSIKNLLIRYDVPCLAFAQLNRDGIDSNATSAVAGSDRLLMYCSSLTFFKAKTTEEIQEYGIKNGNRKLFVVASRNGPGTDEDDYINIKFDRDIGRMAEGKTFSQIKEENADKEGFEYTGDKDEEIHL